MIKQSSATISLTLVVCLVLLLAGCEISQKSGQIKPSATSKAAGIGQLSFTIGVRDAALLEETPYSLSYDVRLGGWLDKTGLRGRTKSVHDEYQAAMQIMLHEDIKEYFKKIFRDPLVMQFPADAADFSCTWNYFPEPSGSMMVTAGLSSLPVMPGLSLDAEPGCQLVVIDVPDDPDFFIPAAGENHRFYGYTLTFTVEPAREIEVKCINTGKVVIGQQTFYLPLTPLTMDFADVPAITIPVADTLQNLALPTSDQLPHPGAMVTYDFSAVTGTDTMYFPRLHFVPDQATEGFGFVNPGPYPATVTFTSYTATGQEMAVSDAFDWPPGRQNAYQADGIFGLAETTDTWAIAQSTEPGLIGFFLSQLYGGGVMAGMDGAAVLLAAANDNIIPRVNNTGNYTTELFVANPGESETIVGIIGGDGQNILAGSGFPLLPKAFVRIPLQDLFGASGSFDGYIRLQSFGRVIANATIRHGDTSLSSANAIPTAKASEVLYASHIVHYPGLYSTRINLINTTDTAAVATLYPFRADGTPMDAPIEVNIAAAQLVTLADGQLGLPTGENTDGWLRVECPDHPLLGCITFGDPVANRYESTLPLQPFGTSDIYYAQVANGQVGSVNYSTGLAIVNPHPDMAVEVSIAIHLSDGSLNGNLIQRILQPGEKYVRELRTMEGIGDLAHQASGYVHIRATAPVLSFELFYDDGANFLSAVQAR